MTLARHFALLLLALTVLIGLAPGVGLAEDNEGVDPEPLVRIGLRVKGTEAKVGVTVSAGQVIDLVSRKVLFEVDPAKPLTVSIDDGRLRAGKWHADGLALVAGSTGHVALYGAAAPVEYHGYLSFRIYEGDLIVINHCRLDEYLYGVVPAEMGHGWPLEALKAQSVAARTYAVKQMGQKPGDLFDLWSDTKDQMYSGCAVEHPTITKAIDCTTGLILTYDGIPIQAYYHSQSGEETLPGSALRGASTAQPYLQAVPSREGNFQRWVVPLRSAAFRKALAAHGMPCSKLLAVRQYAPDAGLIEVLTDTADYQLPRNDLRWWFKANGFKSANFKVEIDPVPDVGDAIDDDATIQFIGTGNAHGVGMSQYGAMGYAKDGWTYDQILSHFYPGTDLSLWYDMSEEVNDSPEME
ncbi:MAG: SpoIID/LytB domain-containing protein [bacterium]